MTLVLLLALAYDSLEPGCMARGTSNAHLPQRPQRWDLAGVGSSPPQASAAAPEGLKTQPSNQQGCLQAEYDAQQSEKGSHTSSLHTINCCTARLALLQLP